MAKPGQSSFRRILLSRILLLTVPVLLLGEISVYRKTRTSLLGTARLNLQESAARKGQSIEDAIAAWRSNLLSASQTTILQQGTAQQAQEFLNQLAGQMPAQVQCLQLTNISNNAIIASTCGNIRISTTKAQNWLPTLPPQTGVNADNIAIATVLSPPTPNPTPSPPAQPNQLELLLSAPVYDNTGKLRYTLSLKGAIAEQQTSRPKSLIGSTIVIATDGTILAHPIPSRVGSHISKQPDAKRLQSIVKGAIAGREDFFHLTIEPNGEELIAGYTSIPNPTQTGSNQKWVIVAATGLGNALFGLEQIRVVLIILTIGLLGASVVATLFLTNDLARPLEKLRDYTLNLQRHAEIPPPHNFTIRELNQLSEALSQMVQRLSIWAEEIETAWKEAQAANKLKSEFLAVISHELRTPLNAMIGCVRLVREGYCDSPEEEKDLLNRADDAALHLLNIINDLLDMVRSEDGKLSVVLQPLDLRQALEEVIDLHTLSLQQKGLELNYIKSDEPIAVQADPARLKQVLINVVGNAIKFTENGSITITTETVVLPNENAKEQDTDSSQVVIKVIDTGVGIDPEQQHKLFRPFVMVDGSTTRNFGGSGLGLAISRNLLQLMNGSINIYSAGEYQGTTVTITLPLINICLLRSTQPQVINDE